MVEGQHWGPRLPPRPSRLAFRLSLNNIWCSCNIGNCRAWQSSMRTLFILYGTKASIYTWNGWQNDMQLQLNWCTIAAENKGGSRGQNNHSQSCSTGTLCQTVSFKNRHKVMCSLSQINRPELTKAISHVLHLQSITHWSVYSHSWI